MNIYARMNLNQLYRALEAENNGYTQRSVEAADFRQRGLAVMANATQQAAGRHADNLTLIMNQIHQLEGGES